MPTLINITNHEQGREQLGEQAKYDDRWEENWLASIRNVVGKHFLDKFQFLTSTKDEMFGSEWQKQVCEKVGVGAEHQQVFWKRKGMQEARKSLNRRRQNTTTAMKKHFLGKTRMEVEKMLSGLCCDSHIHSWHACSLLCLNRSSQAEGGSA